MSAKLTHNPYRSSLELYSKAKKVKETMANSAKKVTKGGGKKRRPALTPEAKEQQMIGLAMDLAEEQLRNGTASPSVINHFLKLGSSREQIEQAHLSKKVEHLDAQIDSIHSTAQIEELYKNALDAMRLYSGEHEDL